MATPLTRRIALESGLPLPSHTLAGLDAAGTSIRLGTVDVLFPGACAVRAQAASTLGNVAHAQLPAWRAALERAIARYPTATLVVPGHGATDDLALMRHTLALLRR
jgi:glyoxylase-like metal-dependent hydrolase (beta-lactamase superfamily II)